MNINFLLNYIHMKKAHTFLIVLNIYICGCFTDKAHENATINNQSLNHIVINIESDSKKGNLWSYGIIRNSKIDLQKRNEWVVKPKEKFKIFSLRDWNNRIDDTTSLYFYFINLDIVDSLKNLSVDSCTIKRESTKIIKTTYKDLKQNKWILNYP